MKKTVIMIIGLVVTVCLLLLLLLFLNINRTNPPKKYSVSTSTNVSLPDFSSDTQITIPKLNLKDSIVGASAWQIFGDYRDAAQNHNLVKIKELSHQLSLTCSDKSKEIECFAIMDGFYESTKDFKITDFTNTIYDDKQIISYTEYKSEGLDEASKERFGRILMYFTRDSSGSPRLLNIRFCSTDDLNTPDDCVEKDPNKRDLDNNGWWDTLENLFY